MSTPATSPLAAIEPRLRLLLPAALYAAAWIDPSPDILGQVFEHLRTLLYILADYAPRQVATTLPQPGEIRYAWQEGALLFTDLAGFTPLMEAYTTYGQAGAGSLLGVLNDYFAEMIELVSKAGGNLLEFTGDAILAQFPASSWQNEVIQAVRVGLRMQRAMARFANIETEHGAFSLGMRVGIHCGRFLTADVGTPRRMEHVLLGNSVRETKKAEGAGQVVRVCLTEAAYARARDHFRFEPAAPGYRLVVDDLTADDLGEYEIASFSRRLPSIVLLDRSIEGMVAEIEKVVVLIEPLASYLPLPILNLVVETAAQRRIAPKFLNLTVLFVNLIGLSESADEAAAGEEAGLVATFSRAFTLINAAVEACGGVLKHVTYHLAGSDIMIYFGVPNAHPDDPVRAAEAGLAIRDIITSLDPPTVRGQAVPLSCKIGLTTGAAFAAEIGEMRGRREFNVLGDMVNTAARLMGHAGENQILISEAVYQAIAGRFACEVLGVIPLKGKAETMPVLVLNGPLAEA